MIMQDSEYSKYIEGLLEVVMIKQMGDPSTMNIDSESYEEVRSLALELENME